MPLTWNLYDEILQGSHLDSYVSTNILTFQILVRNKKKCNPEDQIFPFAREYSWQIALRNCSSWKFDRRRESGMQATKKRTTNFHFLSLICTDLNKEIYIQFNWFGLINLLFLANILVEFIARKLGTLERKWRVTDKQVRVVF